MMSDGIRPHSMLIKGAYACCIGTSYRTNCTTATGQRDHSNSGHPPQSVIGLVHKGLVLISHVILVKVAVSITGSYPWLFFVYPSSNNLTH